MCFQENFKTNYVLYAILHLHHNKPAKALSKTYLCSHVEDDSDGDVSPAVLLQIFQQGSVDHQFGDDVHGLASRAHSHQLHELPVSESVHDFGFFEEGLWTH